MQTDAYRILFIYITAMFFLILSTVEELFNQSKKLWFIIL